MKKIATGLLYLSVLIIGCDAPLEMHSTEVDARAQPSALAEGSPVALGVLNFLNDSSTSEALLDHSVMLDVRAAREIVQHRDGWDNRPGTADDNLFNSLAEVDSVNYVGPAAMSRINAYAQEWGWIPEENDFLGAWEGVSFTIFEAQVTLDFVNECSLEDLDKSLQLDKRAAESIINAQPILSITHLANLYYVGESTLITLKDVGVAMHMLGMDESQQSAPFSASAGADTATDSASAGADTATDVQVGKD
jgi:hypothetical protein